MTEAWAKKHLGDYASRYHYIAGTRVLVEGVVIDYEWGKPYGAVLVNFPTATDIGHTHDVMKAWIPQALVIAPDQDTWESAENHLREYKSCEGFYTTEDE